ncbi:FAD-dependent oxidoreductase [Haliea sp. E17]|uniref:FAD-dependent oxidoreductase n=1 Tax=Haliea sp. E17 TaxID=3401576 RepID=UPI003AB02B35
MQETTPQFDVIVIGSGVTGGWAAKELTEKGLKVLMLDRGRMIEHGKDYTGEHIAPWKIPYRGKPLRELYEKDYSVQSTLYAFNEPTRHYFNNDRENPYVEDPEQFLWYRADVVGGKSLLWGRQSYRYSDLDFEANQRDGHGIDWPIRYKDIAPWYSYVERFVGISGQAEGLPQLPDSEFQKPMEMTALEKQVKGKIAENYDDRIMTIGRVAVLTEPKEGRAPCHYCGPCERGCSVGAYFSTQSSTLPAARKTNNLTLKPDSVVAGIDYDPGTRRATGVRVIDANTREKSTYTAKMIFLCGGTVASTQIMLNSRSEAFPNGLANSSGVLGHYLMDHTLGTAAMGFFQGLEDKVTYGWRPNGIYIPRFRNVGDQNEGVEFLRGYGFQGGSMRFGWQAQAGQVPGFGAEFKHALRKPGPWMMYLSGFGECLPYRDNRITLDGKKTDRFGIPQVRFDFKFRENEEKMREDIAAQGEEMLKKAGAVYTMSFINNSVGGEAIHEMGTARMGNDPKESVLNRWSQSHDVPNLFVTDGSGMTSSSCVNPSLTYMALTARAADYAVTQLGEGAI